LSGRSVQIRADRVVQRGEAVRLLLTDALDEPRELALTVARGADLGIEVDDRDIDGVCERVEELDGGGLREAHVLAHAPADVEQQAEVHLGLIGRVRIADGEVLNGLLFSILVDFEVVLRELGDESALSVADGDTDLDEVHGAPKDRLLQSCAARHQGHKGDKGHKGKVRVPSHRSHSTPGGSSLICSPGGP
jgi:hypothetical protein